MARYKIYDNESNVFTPSGEMFTAEQWLERYPWGKVAKMVVGGGVINGSVAFVYDDFVDMMKKAGCDFTGCTTDEEVLAKIEEFEDAARTASTGISDQTRIADALEDMVALSLPDTDVSDADTSEDTAEN